jgi:hypothetical protein
MPIIVGPNQDAHEDAATQEGDDLLVDEHGQLTLEAETIGLFLADVDWDDAFEHPDVQEHIAVEEVLGVERVDEATGQTFIEVYAFEGEEDDDDEDGDDDADDGDGGSDDAGDDDDEDAEAEATDEGGYGKGKKKFGKMFAKGKKKNGDEEDDEEDVGEATTHSVAEALVHTQPAMRISEVGHEEVPGGPASAAGGKKKYGKGYMKGKVTKEAYEALTDADTLEVEITNAPDGLQVFVIESLPGEIVADIVDEDDLMSMLPYFIHELPEDTLEDKARKAQFADLLDELDETLFKKGNFRKKAAFKAPGGHDQRVRQMWAMFKKGVIRRTKKGKGYRDGSDWKYKKPSGTPAGKRAYAKFKINKIGKIRKLIKTKKNLKKARKGVVKKVIYPNLGAKMPAKWVEPEKRKDYGLGALYWELKGGKKKKAKKGKGGLKKKAAMKKGKGKKSPVAASNTATPPANMTEDVIVAPEPGRSSVISEGAAMAGKMQQHMAGRTVVDDLTGKRRSK